MTLNMTVDVIITLPNLPTSRKTTRVTKQAMPTTRSPAMLHRIPTPVIPSFVPWGTLCQVVIRRGAPPSTDPTSEAHVSPQLQHTHPFLPLHPAATGGRGREPAERNTHTPAVMAAIPEGPDQIHNHTPSNIIV